ncbi:MAG TPA: hypothetical protein VMJ14_05805 [Burkholderiales bacterium]|nr:hypothetical protein [Burkholderiales bacterium]
MKAALWVLIIASFATVAWTLRLTLVKMRQRKRNEEARAEAFLAQMSGATARKDPPGAITAPAPAPTPPAAPANETATQKLLFEAAHKAGEAGEPALAIQLYARLLARYPATGFAEPARAAAAALKKKLVKN